MKETNLWNNLTQRQVRYWCFRKRTEAEGGSPAEDAPESICLIEEQKANIRPGLVLSFTELGGWKKFADKWDVEVVDGELRVVARERSVWREWNEKLASIVPILGDF